MNWFIIALLAPLLWAITNFIDKFLISKYFKGKEGAMIIYSTLIGIPVFVLIYLFFPHVLKINPITALIIILNSFLLVIYLFPYLKALDKADASIVVPIFQTAPVFSYFLAYFILKETISNIQIIGSLLIILGAIGISLKFEGKKIHLTKDVLFLQLLASFLVALNFVLFKLFALELDFWIVSFWEYVGLAIFGIFLLFFVKNYREDFFKSIKLSGKKIIGLNTLNEILNISATIIFSFATLLAPLALVWVVNGFQPVFIFFIGIFLTIFFPHIIKENLSAKIVIQKIIFILIIALGTYLLNVI